jgi:hypothetical protein
MRGGRPLFNISSHQAFVQIEWKIIKLQAVTGSHISCYSGSRSFAGLLSPAVVCWPQYSAVDPAMNKSTQAMDNMT